jgi:hypothetical protein
MNLMTLNKLLKRAIKNLNQISRLSTSKRVLSTFVMNLILCKRAMKVTNHSLLSKIKDLKTKLLRISMSILKALV